MHPIVVFDSDGGAAWLVGGSRNGNWLDQSRVGRSLHGGARFHFYSMTGSAGSFTGGKPETGEGNITQYFLSFQGLSNPPRALVGISGSWNPLPRRPVVLDNNLPVYRNAVASLLVQKGIPASEAHVDRVLRVDLDGDGQDEVLISATRPGSAGVPEARKGDYTLVMLRKIVHGQVRTTVVEGLFFPHGEGQMTGMNERRLVGAFDLKGDGKMEIVCSYKAYEAGGITVYALTRDGVKEVLSAGVAV